MRRTNNTAIFILAVMISVFFARPLMAYDEGVTNTFHRDYGSLAVGRVGLSGEWQFNNRTSILASLGIGFMRQFQQVPSYGDAYIFELSAEPRYYLRKRGVMGLFATLPLTFGAANVPYFQSGLVKRERDMMFSWGVKVGYSWPIIFFKIHDIPVRMSIEPYVRYSQIFFSPPNSSEWTRPANYWTVGVDFLVNLRLRPLPAAGTPLPASPAAVVSNTNVATNSRPATNSTSTEVQPATNQ